MHLVKAFGDKRLDEISTEDVQRLKAALIERAPKTVNNVLTVLGLQWSGTQIPWRNTGGGGKTGMKELKLYAGWLDQPKLVRD